MGGQPRVQAPTPPGGELTQPLRRNGEGGRGSRSNGLGKHNGMGPNGNVYRTTGTRHRWDTTDVSRGTTRDTAAIPEATRDRTIR